jgi:hypothetical protein
MPITIDTTLQRITTSPQSDLRQVEIQLNAVIQTLATLMDNQSADGVVTPSTLSRGTTVTLAATASVIQINGVPASVAALTAQAFGSLGTIPAGKWGIIALERIAAGTASFTSGAANYTTGYDTEADALAALPAQTADKVQVGYLTILGDADDGWVAGTDALAGGTGGNPAQDTNYYSVPSLYGQDAFTPVQIADQGGRVLTSELA